MPRRRAGYTTRNAYRALARIEAKAEDRALEIAKDVVRLIAIYAPRDPNHEQNTGGPALWQSYYATQDPTTGDVIIGCRRRYWAFVEFGTREHGRAQPHVRPALDAVRRINS
jgi:hypothetical protein